MGFEKFIETPGWRKPNSRLDLSGESVLVRSDLTIKVGSQFWEEFRNISAPTAYGEFAARNHVEVIFAEKDTELGSRDVPVGVAQTSIQNADHDFSDGARSVLINLLVHKIGLEPKKRS